jgi:hypothetical protein
VGVAVGSTRCDGLGVGTATVGAGVGDGMGASVAFGPSVAMSAQYVSRSERMPYAAG